MKLRQTAVRSLAASALGLSVIGGGIAIAPTASAANGLPANCVQVYSVGQKTTTAVNLRTGPSTKYKSRGVLSKGTRFTEYCTKNFIWYYGKVANGAHKNKKGWVHGDYIKPIR
ncbi:SH3 domain-containing protein [Streptomyces chartreusis]|uniref:SH3 domain-containing protein n=1 Tax=Streptomyces chartreusis TaxID=1969 RepID=UPI00386590C8|nr:SH3 domain-containing protein [Streptomyces chartreusis]WTA29153.1 SH3 domain-containing protein [Streptomyces chartreusis]